MPKGAEVFGDSVGVHTEPFDCPDHVPVTGEAEETAALAVQVRMIASEPSFLGFTGA